MTKDGSKMDALGNHYFQEGLEVWRSLRRLIRREPIRSGVLLLQWKIYLRREMTLEKIHELYFLLCNGGQIWN